MTLWHPRKFHQWGRVMGMQTNALQERKSTSFDDLLSSINGDFWTFENSCMSVPTTAKLLNFWTLGKISSHLRKNFGVTCSHLGVQSALGGVIFEPPKMVKIELSCRRELNLGNICWHICFTFFLRAISQNMKIKLSPARELNFGGPVASVVTFHALSQRFGICVFEIIDW